MKAFNRVITVIFLLLLPIKAVAEITDEINHLYYTFSTREFPELNEAINTVLQKTPLEQSSDHLTQVTIDVYKNWHEQVLRLNNTTIPEAASTVVKHLTPKGFAGLPKFQVLPDPIPDWQQPAPRLIVTRFLSILGIAFSQNPVLHPVKKHLELFFSCDHTDCQQFADKQTDQIGDDRITAYMQFYTDCINNPDILKQNKIRLCEAFLLQPVTETGISNPSLP